MNLKKIFLALFFYAVASVCFADPIGGDEANIQAIAAPIMENIIEGIKSNDYNKYIRDFDSATRSAMPEAKFIEVNERLSGSIGEFKQKEYIGFLDKQNMTVVMWKTKFTKTDDDILIKLVINKSGDVYYVSGLWFE